MDVDVKWIRPQGYAGHDKFEIVIPSQFKTLGLYDKAWRSFYEQINPLSMINYNDDHGVLGQWAAVYWYQAADCAYRAGEKRRGWNLLMKAAVFGDEKTFGDVKKAATLWLDCEENKKELPPPELFAIPWHHESGLSQYGMKEFEEKVGPDLGTKNRSYAGHIKNRTWHNPRLRDAMLRRNGEPGLTEQEIRREAWDFIIETYVKMNAHPRAWALLDEYPDEFENPKELKKKIQDDWLDLVKPLIQTAKQIDAIKVEIYGQILYPNGIDPLDVKIPWAFPKGSVERAKKDLQNELNKIKNGTEK